MYMDLHCLGHIFYQLDIFYDIKYLIIKIKIIKSANKTTLNNSGS